MSTSNLGDLESSHHLAAAAPTEEAEPGRAKPTSGQLVRATTRTVKKLLAQKRYDEVLTEILALPPNHSREYALVSARLTALERSGRVDELKAAFEEFFGPLLPDLEQMLANLPIDKWNTAGLKRASKAFYSLDPLRPVNLETYRRQYVWGHAAACLIDSLVPMKSTEPSIDNLARQARSISRSFDHSPLISAERDGRSILVARAHGGLGTMANKSLAAAKLSLPKIRLTRTAPTSGSNTNFSTKANSHTNFLKIVKLVKNSPHQILIFPDAGDGGEVRTFDLLGRKVGLRMGAATIAWYGKAATFFVGGRWHEGRPQTYLAEGPIADGRSREDFEDAFCRFYLEQIEAIACGPAENIVMENRGGLWASLLSPVKA